MILEAILTSAFEFAISKTFKPARTAYSKWRRPKPAQNWIPRLNSHFSGEVIVFGDILKSEPKVALKGRYSLDKERQEVAGKQLLQLQNERKRNDPHAILVEQPRWGVDPIYLTAKTLYFSEVRALRDAALGNLRPEVLRASAV